MRLHLRRCVWLTLIVVSVQVVITYWGVRRPRYLRREVQQLDRDIGDSVDQATGTCNPDLCNPVRDDMLNVHIVAHSHDDVGWLKTMDQYYDGQKNVGAGGSSYSGQECVRCVLNTTIPELLEDPKRRFIFIEMAFFSKYWNEINPQTRDVVRDLIKQRRLEFTIGGWCMSDSANTFYNDIIDQHTLGFDFIDQHFGPCAQSRTAWHVDQFGHSREHSSLFAQMGFDSIILGRIDHQDIAHRQREKTLEMVWNASPDSLGDKASLFTHISGGYYSPKGYVMESWAPNKMHTQPLKGFLAEIESKRKSQRTNHVMIPLGSDFGYKRAGEWFDNIDILIERVNAMQKDGSKINVLYSTPSCYFHHVNRAQQTPWPTKADDFFPYAIDNGYWTGFYTSKGGLKLHVKKAGALLQTCKQLSVFAGLGHVFNRSHVLKEAVAVLQHHDAITGTEKEHVVRDYNKMLSKGETLCQDIIQTAYQTLTTDGSGPELVHNFCPNLNISECSTSESSHKMAVFAYNPLSRPVTSWIRFPVTHAHITVKGQDGDIETQMLPVTEVTMKIPGRTSEARAELLFKAELPPMGFSTFFVEGEPGRPEFPEDPTANLPLDIKNEHISVTFDQEGRISEVTNLVDGITLPLRQEYAYYESKSMSRPSGAYIFAPKIDKSFPFKPSNVKIYKGSQVTEVHQQFGDFITQVVRLYANSDNLELEWTVGPIPVEKDGVGKEVISVFTSNIKSDGEFYTDSNGRENLKRKRDHRETWDLKLQQRISGNYYPVTSNIFLKDKERDLQMTVLSDRSQGGSSINDGQLELMVHRRTLRDDGLGVGEPLNERSIDGKGLILRGKHYLHVGSNKTATRFQREKPLEIHFNPTVSFVPLDSLQGRWDQSNQNDWSALRSSLPPNVQILSLDYVKDNVTDLLLLRLEHIYEKGADPEFSKPATFDLGDVFSAFEIVGIEELSLGANFKVSQVKRMRWKTDSGLTPEHIGAFSPLQWESPLLITLHPMEIRTFHIQVQPVENTGSIFKHIFR